MMKVALYKNTKVLTQNGLFPIKYLLNKKIKIVNRDGDWEIAKCIKSKKLEIYDVKFDDGSEYKVSSDTDWNTYNKNNSVKKKTKDLKIGDFINSSKFNRKSLFNGKKGNNLIGFVIGWFYGDGNLTYRKDTKKYVANFIFNEKDKHIMDKVLKVISVIDGVKDRKITKRTSAYEFQVGSDAFINYLMNVYGVHKKSKGLPSNMLTEWNDECIRGFIDGIFSSDGSVTEDGKRITWTSSENKLAKELHELLGLYGIKSKLSVRKTKGNFPNKKNYNKEYKLNVINIGLDSTIKFSKLFSLRNKEKERRLKLKKESNSNIKEFIVVENITKEKDIDDTYVLVSRNGFQLSTISF